ncbi:MAG: diacylglycerol kinase family lipid kinase [Myxococcota bacterium]|nr:diacylglycerol kinase family lipid kinase [Myxococcota bacterium]
MRADRLVAILNPAAGGGRARARAVAALDALRNHGIALRVRETTGPGEASRIAAEAFREGVRRFVVVGGDGTAHEVLNGLFPLASSIGERPVVGMLPVGTGNSFLRDFGLGELEAAVRAIGAGRSRPVDLIRVRHASAERYAFNIVSVGFSARVGALTNARLKPLGTAGYAVAVLASLARLRAEPRAVRLDQGPVDRRAALLLSFCNSQYTGGGMRMAPGADPSDGRLDVVRVGPMGRLRLVATLPALYRGEHVHAPGVETARARRVELEDGREEDVVLDGELLRLALRSLEVVPGAFEVMA